MKHRWILLVVLSLVGQAIAAPRLVMRSTLSDPQDPECSVLLREIPRQALIVAATEDLGVQSVDLTLEPQATIHSDDVTLDFTCHLAPAGKTLTITLLDTTGKPLAERQIAPSFSSTAVVSLAEVGRLSEAVVHEEWCDVIRERLGIAPIAPRWRTAATLPADTERLLSTIDFAHAFLAARQLHQTVAADGQSIERLSALSRAYINLGESTRHLFGGQADAALGRGLIYADRLVRRADRDPLAYWTRAYAESMIGLPADSDADLQQAAKFAGPIAPPAWVTPLALFNHARTTELRALDHSPLASYLAWRSVEPCKLSSVINHFGRNALDQNPGAVRVFDAMVWVGGVAMHHESSIEAPRMLNRLVATLANDPAAPAEVRGLVSSAVRRRFDPPSIIELLNQLRDVGNDEVNSLTFATFVSLVRDCQLVDAVRALQFQGEALFIDPTEVREQWIALLDGHRLVPLLKSFNPPHEALPSATLDAVKKLRFDDMGIPLASIYGHLMSVGLPQDPRTGKDWEETVFETSDPTTWDYAIICRHVRGPSDKQSRVIPRLDSIAPDQPMLISAKLEARDPKTLARADDLEKASGNQPIIALALG